MQKKLYVDDFDRLRNHRYEGDNYDKILSTPRAFWCGWDRYDKHKFHGNTIRRLLKRANDDIVTFVLYNMPNRDKNHYSKGGTKSTIEYKEYVDDFAAAIDRECIVIVEPDALAHAVSFNEDDKQERFDCLSYAVGTLLKTKARVYIDVGHPKWLKPSEAAKLIKLSNVRNAHGFSVNVSNFVPIHLCIKWATKLSEKLDNMHYVVDTSRNGAIIGVEGWCNPKGAQLGQRPTLTPGYKNCDAFLWIKTPEESDGKANGAPHAGKINLPFANKLVQ